MAVDFTNMERLRDECDGKKNPEAEESDLTVAQKHWGKLLEGCQRPYVELHSPYRVEECVKKDMDRDTESRR